MYYYAYMCKPNVDDVCTLNRLVGPAVKASAPGRVIPETKKKKKKKKKSTPVATLPGTWQYRDRLARCQNTVAG